MHALEARGLSVHDGTELTAEDVKFTFETILDEEFASPSRAFYTPIQSVEVVDDYTVKFTLDAPYGPFLSYMDMSIVPKALAAAAVVRRGNLRPGTDRLNRDRVNGKAVL